MTDARYMIVLKASVRYSIASMLAVGNLDLVLWQINRNEYLTANERETALDFAKLIDKHYRKRNGFIPGRVIPLTK